jgi:hypothetical protein
MSEFNPTAALAALRFSVFSGKLLWLEISPNLMVACADGDASGAVSRQNLEYQKHRL